MPLQSLTDEAPASSTWVTVGDPRVSEMKPWAILEDCLAFPDVHTDPRVPDHDEARKL